MIRKFDELLHRQIAGAISRWRLLILGEDTRASQLAYKILHVSSNCYTRGLSAAFAKIASEKGSEDLVVALIKGLVRGLRKTREKAWRKWVIWSRRVSRLHT
jgi:hypothetical protein